MTKYVAAAVLTLVFAVAVTHRPSVDAQQVPAQPKWEYGRLLIGGVFKRFVTTSVTADTYHINGKATPSGEAKLEQVLDVLGAQGWEYAGQTEPVMYDKAGADVEAQWQMIFKRRAVK